MARYIIADKQDLTRRGTESLLREYDTAAEISYAADKLQLLTILSEEADQTVIIDYPRFDFNDVEQFLMVTERFSKAAWVIISNELPENWMRKLIYSTNRVNIVFKDSTEAHIHEAISSANRRTRFISQRATEVLLGNMQENAPTQSLTPTESEILKAIVQGKTTKEIAQERICSIHTINAHRKNIFKKLKVNTAHEATKYALRAGLVDTAEFYI